MSNPLPDKNTDFALSYPFIVALTKTVRPGFPVKITGFKSGTNDIIEVEEAILVTDIAIGICMGALGVNGPGAAVAGALVNIEYFGHVVDRMIVGAAGATIGKRLTYSTTGVVDAPTPAAAGTVCYECPGVALGTGTSGQAIAVLFMPMTTIA